MDDPLIEVKAGQSTSLQEALLQYFAGLQRRVIAAMREAQRA
jgi:hypothetical protein